MARRPETVTVRMVRGEMSTPWGFLIAQATTGETFVSKVHPSSLADRAGLREDDVISQVEGLHDLQFSAAQALIDTAKHQIQLILHRNTSQRSSQRPVSSAPPPSSVPSTHSVSSKPSQQVPVLSRVKHNQYNSPLAVYSMENAMEQLQLHATQPRASGGQSSNEEKPQAFRSETMRLIQEEAARGARANCLSSHPNPEGLPNCFVCQRPILGKAGSAEGRSVHVDCLACATCGASLVNAVPHVIEEKLYCEVHGRQRKGAAPHLHITPPTQQHNGTFTAHATSLNYHNPKSAGSISPAARGVPSKYGSPPSYAPPPPPVPSYTSSLYRTGVEKREPTPRAVDEPVRESHSTSAHSFHSSSYDSERKNGGILRDGERGTASMEGSVQSNGGPNVAFCQSCQQSIRGPFVLAGGKSWCPQHFVCSNSSCGRRLLECGFVEEKGQKFCEGCFERHIAPRCAKCATPITSDCLNALQKKWHPSCFTCSHCMVPFGNAAFYLEQGQPYCERDWNMLFTTKCVSCKLAIEAGDRWVEALGSAYHSNCFICTRCHANLEGESFYAKNGAPYCKTHA